MAGTSASRGIAISALIALTFGAFASTDSLADAASTEAPIYGVATSIPAFWVGHSLGPLFLRQQDRWNTPPQATALVLVATVGASAGLDPIAALPLALFSGAAFWPQRRAA